MLEFGSWPLVVMLGATRGAILCRMDDGSPSRPALVAPKSMVRHHDPDGLEVMRPLVVPALQSALTGVAPVPAHVLGPARSAVRGGRGPRGRTSGA